MSLDETKRRLNRRELLGTTAATGALTLAGHPAQAQGPAPAQRGHGAEVRPGQPRVIDLALQIGPTVEREYIGACGSPLSFSQP